MRFSLLPATAAAMDFDTFTFPPMVLTTREEHLTYVEVTPIGRGHTVFRDYIAPTKTHVFEELHRMVETFNADPISGWCELVTDAMDQELADIEVKLIELRKRRRAATQARESVGWAALRTRGAQQNMPS